MLSYQDQYGLCQKYCNDTSSDGLAFFKQHLNLGLHLVEDALGSFYTEETRTDTTTTSDTYETPDNYVRFKDFYVTGSDSVRHHILAENEVKDESLWQELKSQPSTADFPTHIFFRKDTYELYPTPATAGYTMTLRYEASNKDLSADDYTTGTILTLANAGTAVTGTNTPAWTSVLIGRYFKIDAYPIWYKITAIGSTTTLTLQKKYQGIAIAAGSEAYTIGEMPNIPPSIHILPVYFACSAYFAGPKVDADKSAEYQAKFMGTGVYAGTGLNAAKERWGHRSTNKVIKGQRSLRRGGIRNPNFYPTVIT